MSGDTPKATVEYNFDCGCWVAVASWDQNLEGHGDTPQKAVDSLKFQCNKHALWPIELPENSVARIP